MAGYSARQSSFTTGDTILAAHSNDEFNQVLAAFHATTGHSHDGTAGEGGPISTLRDADSNNKILVDTSNNHLEFYVEVSSSAVEQVKIQDGAIVPVTDNDIDLGTSSLEFKDLYVDGTAHVDAINYNGTAIASTAAELNIVDGDTSATSTTVADADRVVLNDNGTMVQVAVTDLAAYFDDEITAMPNLTSVGTLTTINGSTISDSGDFTIDGGADIILDADGGDIFFKDGGTTFGSATNTSGNLIIKSGTTTALTFSGADVTIAGDLTVSGDDITMGTNTAGHLLIADGTNFNSVAATSLTEISTVANDDVLLAVDTSGGGLKKITRSTLVSGLAATGAAISNVVEDTSPQLGADLDTNSFNIAFDDAHGINDENGNEQIIFQTTSSAVNQFDITNAATGNAPKLSATGGDSNIDLEIEAKGTGHITVRGNTNAGAIQFNCESNSHGQILKSQPHSAAVTNEMLLPAGSNSTLVSLVSTDTLENKTLTTPVIAEIDSGSTITLDATTDIVLDADGGDIIFKDGGTSIATFTNSSTDFIIVTFEVGSNGDINIPANIGLTFGDDGEKIEGDGTDLTITDNNINLTATADVVIPANVGITFGSGEKIEGDSTDLTITSGAKINLTATSDVHIPNNVGIVFGGDSEKIEGDGTDMTIGANNLTIDAAADINLDADGADVNIKDGGTTILSFTNSSSDAVVTSGVQDKDIIFKGDDNGSAITALTLDMSDAGTAVFNHDIKIADGGQIGSASDADAMAISSAGVVTFSGAANVGQQALTSSSNAVAWDASAKPNAFHVTTENTTFSAPTNNVEGAFIALEINYNGSHTIAFNTVFEFAASTAPTFTSTDGKTDILVFRYNGSVWQEVGRTLNLSES